ncbi:MAG: transposase [Chloroflexi bacterium]|nr:transposase [Chloroflexota bacterium]
MPAIYSKRRSIRLKGYDYRQPGAYFVTICEHGKESLLGAMANNEVKLTNLGAIAAGGFQLLPSRFPSIEIPIFCVMPNHVHVIICNTNAGRGEVTSPSPIQGGGTPPLPKDALGKIVAFYKYQTTKQIKNALTTSGLRFWQRNYYERVIRNDRELEAIYDYIDTNPANWDREEHQ